MASRVEYHSRWALQGEKGAFRHFRAYATTLRDPLAAARTAQTSVYLLDCKDNRHPSCSAHNVTAPLDKTKRDHQKQCESST